MTAIRFIAMPTADVRGFQAGASDAYGMAPERRISDGGGIPCRHCLDDVAEGEAYLILAHRPFPELQPYAETGPIFLHAAAAEILGRDDVAYVHVRSALNNCYTCRVERA